MFLIRSHIGMQNCLFPPTVLVFTFNFAYTCAVCCGKASWKAVIMCTSLLREKEVYDGAWAEALLWSNAGLNRVTGLDSLLWRRLQYCLHWNANMVRTTFNSKCNLRKEEEERFVVFDGYNRILICFITKYSNILLMRFGSIPKDNISADIVSHCFIAHCFPQHYANPACWPF